MVCERVDIERNEEAVEEVVGQDLIETLDVQRQDVRDVVEMVQMLSHQLFQTTTTNMASV